MDILFLTNNPNFVVPSTILPNCNKYYIMCLMGCYFVASSPLSPSNFPFSTWNRTKKVTEKMCQTSQLSLLLLRCTVSGRMYIYGNYCVAWPLWFHERASSEWKYKDTGSSSNPPLTVFLYLNFQQLQNLTLFATVLNT